MNSSVSHNLYKKVQWTWNLDTLFVSSNVVAVKKKKKKKMMIAWTWHHMLFFHISELSPRFCVLSKNPENMFMYDDL